MYYVYALISEKEELIYVGITNDLKRRVAEHNFGKTKSTKFYIPWKLFYSEIFDNRGAARKREKRLKTSSGKKLLKEILEKTSL